MDLNYNFDRDFAEAKQWWKSFSNDLIQKRYIRTEDTNTLWKTLAQSGSIKCAEKNEDGTIEINNVQMNEDCAPDFYDSEFDLIELYTLAKEGRLYIEEENQMGLTPIGNNGNIQQKESGITDENRKMIGQLELDLDPEAGMEGLTRPENYKKIYRFDEMEGFVPLLNKEDEELLKSPFSAERSKVYQKIADALLPQTADGAYKESEVFIQKNGKEGFFKVDVDQNRDTFISYCVQNPLPVMPPHSSSAMKFYEFFNALFGMFKDKIREQEDFYIEQERQKQTIERQNEELLKEREDVREARYHAFMEKINDPQFQKNMEINQQFADIEPLIENDKGIDFTTHLLSQMFSEKEVDDIFESHKLERTAYSPEEPVDAIRWDAIGTFAGMIAAEVKRGTSPEELDAWISRGFLGTDDQKMDPDRVQKGKQLFDDALSEKEGCMTMGEIFMTASETISSYMGKKVPISSQHAYLGKCVEEMMDVAKKFPKSMLKLPDDAKNTERELLAFEGAVRIGTIAKNGICAQYHLTRNECGQLKDDVFKNYCSDYQMMKGIEYGLALHKKNVLDGKNEDYATVQLGLGHEKFGVEILKEMEFEKDRNTFSKENKEQIRDMIRKEPLKNINAYGKMLYTNAFDKLKKNIVYQKNKSMDNTKKEENKKNIEKTGQEIVRR